MHIQLEVEILFMFGLVFILYTFVYKRIYKYLYHDLWARKS
jgi:hypothetical protein